MTIESEFESKKRYCRQNRTPEISYKTKSEISLLCWSGFADPSQPAKSILSCADSNILHVWFEIHALTRRQVQFECSCSAGNLLFEGTNVYTSPSKEIEPSFGDTRNITAHKIKLDCLAVTSKQTEDIHVKLTSALGTITNICDLKISENITP